MKKTLASLLIALGTLASHSAMAAVIVQFFPQDTHVAVGESTQVEMRISGLDDEILSGFDINLRFNAAVVGSTAILNSFEPQLLPSIFVSPPTGVAGDIDLIANSLAADGVLAAAQANDFVVFTFTFQGLADGFSFINLGADAIFERNFVGRNAASLPVTVIGACISVGTGQCAQQVPEPSTLSLLAVALMGATLVQLRRRRA